MTTPGLTFWSPGKTDQWMAGRRYYQVSRRGSWHSIRPRFTTDLCERFWREHGPDSETGIDPDSRWAVVREFVERRKDRSALILDPLAGVRELPRWTRTYRQFVREFRSGYPDCQPVDFHGSVLVQGPGLLERLRFQCGFWMRVGSWLVDQSIIFPASNTQLCFCHHQGLHVFDEREESVVTFQTACRMVIGLCSSIERVE